MGGWRKHYSCIWNSWQALDPFVFYAWNWLLDHAAYEDGPVLLRGQVPFSTHWSPIIWHRSRWWASRFLEKCVADGCIEWVKSSGGRSSQRADPAQVLAQLPAPIAAPLLAQPWSTISMLNFPRYQGGWQCDAPDPAPHLAPRILITDCTDSTEKSTPLTGGAGGVNLETQKNGKTPFTRDIERLKRYLSDLKADLEQFRQKYGPLGVDVDRTYEDFMATVLNGNGTINLPNPYKYVPPFANGFRTWCQKRIDKKAAIAHVPKKPWTPPEQKGK